METNYDKALRLTSALEELAAQESTLLRSFELDDADRISELADRTEPLVLALGELHGQPEVGALLPRIAALMRWRQENAAVLKEHVMRLLAELHRVDEARGRLVRFAPVYQQGGYAEPHLNAAV